ncbi:MAG TPA: type II secretion system protein [Polyangiaceae bacterium]|jgi:general secretion pathway protein I|nr:type II secretion system protein [Polyangiaceae bacterium]
MTRAGSQRAFTLLEVLVAIAILGLGLTVILGSQVGLFTNASRGEHLTVATNLARCKMGELEVKLLTLGYQLTDETDDGPCCSGDEEANEGYRCSWKVERVTLPELPLSGADAGVNNPGGDGGLDLGPIGLLTGLNQPGGTSLGDKANPTDLAKTLGNAPSPMSLAPMMMSMVYPTLKPMLEASIRKVSVTVAYKEGKFSRELAVTQYVTNPQQGQLDPTVAGTGGGSGLGGLVPGFPGAAPGAGLPAAAPATGFGTK